MEQQFDPAHFVFLAYLAIEFGLLIIGSVRMTLAVYKHPLATKEGPTVKDVEEFRPFLIKTVEDKFLFPHHVWLMRHQMNQSMDEVKYKIENKKAR